MDIRNIKKLKIVPENYESATAFEVSNVSADSVKINLPFATEKELDGYQKDGIVEMFGISEDGLMYFVSKILEKEEKNLLIETPQNFRKIQRRKYSRVPFLGALTVRGAENRGLIPVNISAGGLKFVSDIPYKTGYEYEIRIELVNNLTIECIMEPIHVLNQGNGFAISARFKKIRSIDRIALMQYSMRLKSETENKG